jgi:serine/threonine-protein kinase
VQYTVAGGVTVCRCIEASAISPRTRRRWFARPGVDIASSLAILHSRGLLHGDRRPRNVRSTLDGHTELPDLGAMMQIGVAKRLSKRRPHFARDGSSAPLDGRADLFALGALAHLMLTGAVA